MGSMGSEVKKAGTVANGKQREHMIVGLTEKHGIILQDWDRITETL